MWTGHLALRSGDTAASARFYQQLGMRPVHLDDHFAVLEMRGGTHLVVRRYPDHEVTAPTPWDLMVDDLDTTHDKWQANSLPVTPIRDGPPTAAST